MTKKKRNPLLYKNRKSAKLATEALKQTFKAKPSKGYKYLYKLKNGSVFQTQSKTKGILIKKCLLTNQPKYWQPHQFTFLVTPCPPATTNIILYLNKFEELDDRVHQLLIYNTNIH